MSIADGVGYVTDSGYIRKITLATGAVATIAGDGTTGCVDSATSSSAKIGAPVPGSVVNDGLDLIWADYVCPAASGGAGVLREMSFATGAVSTFAGAVLADAVTIGPLGTLYVARGDSVYSVDRSTGATTLLASLPALQYGNVDQQDIRGLTADGTSLYATAYMYDCDCTHFAYSAVSKIDATTGAITTLYVQPIDTYTYAYGPVVSAGDYLYIAVLSQVVRVSKVPGGVIPIAGASGGFVDGIGAEAWFSATLSGIDTDGTHLWITDAGNYRVRELTAAAPLTAIQPAAWSTTVSMGLGAVSTVAGDGTSAMTDGTGSSASFYGPAGMSIAGGYGYVYDDSHIRRVTLSTGAVATIAGGGTGSCTDSSTPSSATIGGIGSLTNDGSFLYWADTTCGLGSGAGILRRMSLSTGAVSTVPGTIYTDYVTVGPGGKLFVSGGHEIFTVDGATGTTTLLASLPALQYGNVDEQDIRGMTADGTNIYTTANLYNCDCTYSNYSAVSKIDATTGAITTLYAQPYATDAYASGSVVSAGDYLYIATSAQVLRMPKSGGSFSPVAGDTAGTPTGLARPRRSTAMAASTLTARACGSPTLAITGFGRSVSNSRSGNCSSFPARRIQLRAMRPLSSPAGRTRRKCARAGTGNPATPSILRPVNIQNRSLISPSLGVGLV